MSFPKQRGGWMSEPLSLLRRERDQSGPGRRRMALACAAIALAAPPAGSAGSPQPDPASGPSSSGLQPDAFHDAASAATPAPSRVPAAAVLPARNAETLHPLVQAPVTQPAIPKVVIPAVTKPSLPIRPATRPVVTTPVTAAAAPQSHAVSRRAKPQLTRVAVKHHAVPRLQLPTAVRGSFAVPASVRAQTASVTAVARRRDLLPAALALLGLVATSGCLLAVAARSRREGLGA